ncbi:MAG TPA: condensation domain-containing protein, partial [Candidatus Angelobacter sp.]|nr:condensation domain-containing protein [Candidatus Angelobacter sp.]
SPSLPPLPVQYADFALWQRQWLQGQRLEQQLSYWRRQLAPPLPVLELPPDAGAPGGSASSNSNSDSCSSSDPCSDSSCSACSSQSRPAAAAYHLLPAPLARNLLALSRQQGATLFMTLLASFQVLLHRYSGQTDIVVGTDVAGRTHSEVQDLIGFFINQVVIRNSLDGDPQFVELLKRVKHTTLEAYAHQDAPFDRVVATVNPARKADEQPLFRFKLVVHNTPQANFGVDLQIEQIFNEHFENKFDLLLNIYPTDSNIQIAAEYDPLRYSAAYIEGFLDHYHFLLNEIAQQPYQELHALVASINHFSAGRESADHTRYYSTYREKAKHVKRKAVARV